MLTWLTWLTALAAHAAPLDGWENSRWLVEIEETLPTQFEISGPDANAPIMRAFQVQAVLTCPDFKMAGKKAAYVTCTAESFALRGSPQAFPGDRLAEYEASFSGLQRAMAEGSYEFKIKQDGKLGSIDFREPPKTDPITVEAARSLAIDLLNGFALARADVPEGTPWTETNSTLIRAPIQPLGNGKTKVTHQPLPDEGGTWIQTTGGGTFTSNYLSWGAGRVEQIRGAAAAGGQYGTRGQGTMLVTKTFISEFQSMTFDAGGPGPFVERMWNTISKPMQDMTDMTGTEGTPLWSAGHIKRLGPDDQVNLGESGLVSAPGATFGELPKWSPMPTLGG